MFQSTIVKKYITTQSKDELISKWDLFKSFFHDIGNQNRIRELKEEQFQEGFLDKLFVEVFGYIKKPLENYNLVTELKNPNDSRKVDGGVIFNDVVKCVIELKGTNTTDLGRVEVQAFSYKNNQPNCKYIVTSNFEKLRFYIEDATEFLEFNLFELTQDEFDLMYLCLSSKSVESDIPLKLKSESVSQEDLITKKLYKDYSIFKRELFNNLTELNQGYDKLLLFKKSQKLLDRFLFLFFGEDKFLLPPNSVRLILDDWKDLLDKDVEISLYDRFKKYFGYLNTGFKGKRYDVFPYNGGLFKPDDVLDNILIDDELLYNHTKKLSEYDFESEVDVNILGHIFENSLNEIEEISNELISGEVVKSTSKRKKDGVFYTPKYITKYIVDNTIGKLCDEKKNELQINDEDYITDKKRIKKTIKGLSDKLNEYRNWLLELTICDPSCGSGAFLNQSLDFLIKEHRYVDELQSRLFGDSLVLSDIENSILENNLFGVDINEESVEITKLSLWLRTAQPNRKLNSLSSNIKCGNSLIDEPIEGVENYFKWEKEFPKVFENGGFDVVIGNPPYVNLERNKEMSLLLEKQGYKTYDKRGDLYILFVERGFNLLKKDSIISYIMPNKWLQSGYGKNLREYFLSKELITLIDFGDIQVFEGATTYPCIFVSKKSEPKSEISVSVLKSTNSFDFNSSVLNTLEKFETSKFSSDTWVISSKVEKELLSKLEKYKSLGEFINGESNYGIKPGLTEAFVIDDETKQKLISEDINSKNIISPILRGRNITRYGTPNETDLDNIILSSFGSYKIIEKDYPSIYNHLLKYEDKLKKRGQCNGSKETKEKPFKGQHHWLELDNTPLPNYLNLFLEPKIMYQVFQVKPCFIYDEQGLYCNNSMWIIPTDNKSLLGVLNSKMGWWLITKYCTQIQNGCQLIWKYFKQIPIPDSSNPLLTSSVDLMISLNKELQDISLKFQRTLQRNFEGLDVLPRKIQEWYLLSFNEFLKELSKKKVKLSLEEEGKWEDFFISESKRTLEIKDLIDKTDKEIDSMVYQLYNLTDEEIKIVESTI